METQNAEVTVYFPETGAENSPPSRFSRPEKLNNRALGWPSAHRGFGCNEVPTVTRAQLKQRNHGDMPVKTRLATPKRITLNPGAADEDEAVNSRPSVDISPLFLMSPYPITVATHGSVGWALATLAIIGFLTVMLMVGIAISV